jgi:hypothetical protein
VATLTRALTPIVRRWEVLCLGLLVIGAAWPQGPNSAQGIVGPYSYFGVWSVRVGPLNLFEIAFVALAAVWFLRRISVPGTESSFDRPLLVAAAALATFQLLAIAAAGDDVQFLLFDMERVLVPMAGYVIVTRCIHDLSRLRLFLIVVSVAIVARAVELVVLGGLGDGTDFGTATGRRALLITEDSLLLALPLILAWGSLIDGRLRLPGKVATVLFAAAVLAVDLLSLRRGPLLFISFGLVARSLAGPRFVRTRLIPVALVAVVAWVAFAPGGVAEDARYTVRSAVLQSGDSSSGLRTAELRNFVDNLDGLEWVIGRGLGTVWHAGRQAGVDMASYGSGETAYVRIGWHVYGLDYAYKFGILGVLVLLATGVALGLRLLRSTRPAGGWVRSYGLSLAVCLLAFLPFVFTGLRIGMVAGLVLGVMSKLTDLAPTEAGDPSIPAGAAAAR